MKYLKLFEEYSELSKIKTFKKRKEYLKSNNEIGKGTGRIVYDISDGKVIKLAKNKKGIAQNLVESNPKIQEKYSNVVATIFDFDKDGKWIIQEKAEPINMKDISMYLGGENDDSQAEGFFYWLRGFGGSDMDYFYMNIPFAKKCYELVNEFELDRFDVSDISSWGKINGKPVLVDYGLDKNVAKNLYQVNY